MKIASRLQLLSKYFGYSDHNEFRKALKIFATSDPNNQYPKANTIDQHFNETRTRKGNIEPSQGAKRRCGDAMELLVSNFLKEKAYEKGIEYNDGFDLNSKFSDFIIELNFSLGDIRNYLSPDSKDILDAFTEYAIHKTTYIPRDMRIPRKVLQNMMKDVFGCYSLYRFRGEQHADNLPVEEKIDVLFDTTARLIYTDHWNQVYFGTLIYSNSKLTCIAIDKSSSIDSFNYITITIYLNFLDSYNAERLVTISRFTDKNKSHTYRAIIKGPEKDNFSQRGKLDSFCDESIRYYLAVENRRAATGTEDSSFVADLDVTRGELKRGREMEIYWRKIYQKNKHKSLEQLIDSIDDFLEGKRFPINT